MPSGLLKCFCICLILHILSSKYFAVLEYFSYSSSHLILAQTFAPFDCLCFPWYNFSCEFSIIGLTSCLKFSCKVLSLYLSREILLLSCKVLFLEKDGTCFFSAGLCILQQVTCGGGYFSHI